MLKDHRELQLCMEDTEWKKEYIDHDRAVARAIVFDDEGYFYFLRVERDDDFGKGIFIETAGGGVETGENLQEAITRYPGAALDLQRLMMDFTLPATSGEGKPLTANELSALRKRLSPSVFFSQELCARYFTYMQNGQAHFVLFDDAETLQQKMNIAEKLGYQKALMMYPEIIDLTEQLFPPLPQQR